jgi:cation transport ATPase
MVIQQAREDKMAEHTDRNEHTTDRDSRMDWSAIWAGLFTFVAIWSVFGLLGIAIFARAGNADAANPLTGATLGMDIWAIVLTIIAMYVAGRETGRLAAVGNRHDGLIHGMIMFGLSAIAVALLAVVGGSTSSDASLIGGMHSRYLPGLSVNLAWTGFLSLFLGWLAAMGGATTGAQRRTQPEKIAQPIKPAA